MTSFIRLAALSLALGAYGISAAHADDFATAGEHDQVIMDAAKSQAAEPLGKAQSRIVEKMYGYRGVYPAPPPVTAPLPLNHYATTGRSLSAPDVVGNGGPQDDAARAIYQPGTGTDW
jgi:hypothetical protein